MWVRGFPKGVLGPSDFHYAQCPFSRVRHPCIVIPKTTVGETILNPITVFCGHCVTHAGVEQDYLEVPSMAFEQMVYREDVLGRLSSHFETHAPLDAATIARVARAKGHLSALRYRRFLAQVSLFRSCG